MQKNQITYKQEIARKLIHLLSLIIPIGYLYLSKNEMLLILTPITILVIIVDTTRHYSPVINGIFNKCFGKILRKHELSSDKKSWTGTTPLFLSCLICIAIFPKFIAITAILILIISDTCAALIGRKFGKHKLLDKSIEGTAAFITSAIFVIIVMLIYTDNSNQFLIAGIAASFVAGAVELTSKKVGIDDNFSVPIAAGSIMWLFTQEIYLL